MPAYLSIDSISASFGASAPVLDRVSLEVQRGEMVALLGPSGCGKTTLLRAIAGFVTPQSGRIVVDGRDITALPPEARQTAMMFQSYALWPLRRDYKRSEITGQHQDADHANTVLGRYQPIARPFVAARDRR